MTPEIFLPLDHVNLAAESNSTHLISLKDHWQHYSFPLSDHRKSSAEDNIFRGFNISPSTTSGGATNKQALRIGQFVWFSLCLAPQFWGQCLTILIL
jgi:hypothetical protein